jgi:tetratricopeptide (TPR) repeat protein
MSDFSRSDTAPTHDAMAAVDRDAKIEQLLLVGLDHYFAAQYQQAINVWTRALFLDRNHARARAYIERARSAMAERQRQSEEMLQHGVDAFQRGEGDEARRLLQAAMDGGAPSEEALALLGRLDRLDATVAPPAQTRPDRARPVAADADATRSRALVRRSALVALAVAAFGGAAFAVAAVSRLEWSTLPRPPASVAHETVLPLPRRGDIALARARALAESGRLHDALAALDEVRSTDPRRADADLMRGDLQRQLLAVTRLP